MKLSSWLTEIVADLSHFAQTLDSLNDTAPLANALIAAMGSVRATAYQRFTDDRGRKYRSIRLPNLPIVPPASDHVRPTQTKIISATIHLVYECYEDIDKKTKMGDDHLDRIRKAEFQVCIEGTVAFGKRTVLVQDHWRMDTHHYVGASSEPHPQFHFQRGGHAQDEFSAPNGFVPGECLVNVSPAGLGLRALMQTSSPRIAAPPMDPISAIDFVISQHNGSTWRSLWAIPEYGILVRKAQDRLWQPYFTFLNDQTKRARLLPFYGGAARAA
jgi:hypothetical protein